MYYEDYEDEYTGTYAHDVAGFSDEDIDTIFDGELSASEIVRRKFELYVVKLESGNDYLCDSKSLQVENIVNGLTDNKDNNYSI